MYLAGAGGRATSLVQPSASRNVAPVSSAGVSAVSPTVKGDPTPSPVSFDPRFVRVLWMYVADRQSIVFQEEERAGTITEMRLVRVSDAAVVAIAPVRTAAAGEPRVCGHADFAPPFVASISADNAVLTDLRGDGGPNVYRLEGHTSGSSSWFAVQLLDWSKLAGGACFL